MLGLFAPVLVRGIMWYLDRVQANKEMREAAYAFISQISKNSAGVAKLYASYQSQHERLKAEINEVNNGA